MSRFLGSLTLAAAVCILGCNSESAPADDSSEDTAPAEAPAEVARHEKVYELVTAAATQCEKVRGADCAAEKALKQFTSDLWMKKVKMEEPERLQAFKTAIDLLGHEDPKARAFAVAVIMNDYLHVYEAIYKDPSKLHESYIEKMLAAIPNLEDSLDNGFLMQSVAKLVPAYDMTDKAIEVAKANLAKNQDLVTYALKNMVHFAKLKRFDLIKKYTADLSDLKNFVAALQAVTSIQSKLSPEEKTQVCEWQKTLVPDEWPAEYGEKVPWDFSQFGYNYFRLVLACRDVDSIDKVQKFKIHKEGKDFLAAMKKTVDKLKLFKQIDALGEEIAAVKKTIEDEPKKAKKAKKKLAKLEKKLEKLNQKLTKLGN